MKRGKVFGLFMICLLWAVIHVLIYTNTVIVDTKKPEFKKIAKPSAPAAPVRRGHPYKTIILWDKISWFKGYEVSGDVCGYCHISLNRSLVYDENTAAVVINVWSQAPSNFPPLDRRRQDQIYVFWAGESPGRTLYYGKYKVNLDLYPPDYFNATMTFRRDSTFQTGGIQVNVLPGIRRSDKGVERDTDKLLAMKKRTAVFVTSNCKASGGSNVARRLRVAQEMVDLGLQVDRFGLCFPENKISTSRKSGKESEFLSFLAPYKFYLSFENSFHCRDYITEKFFRNGLMAGLVPVALGAKKEDYLAVAPPHSFVHVEDFNSTKELVDYLKYLDRNETAYAEYFEWRRKGAKSYLPPGNVKGFCAICRAVHGIAPNDTRRYAYFYGSKSERYPDHVTPGLRQTIPSIYRWWHGDETKECLGLDNSTVP